MWLEVGPGIRSGAMKDQEGMQREGVHSVGSVPMHLLLLSLVVQITGLGHAVSGLNDPFQCTAHTIGRVHWR